MPSLVGSEMCIRDSCYREPVFLLLGVVPALLAIVLVVWRQVEGLWQVEALAEVFEGLLVHPVQVDDLVEVVGREIEVVDRDEPVVDASRAEHCLAPSLAVGVRRKVWGGFP